MKQLVKLRERRDRDEAGLFLVEGYREVRRALEKGIRPKEFYFCPDWFLGENEPALIEQARQAGAQLFELSKDAFAKVAYRERPDGLLAVAPQWRARSSTTSRWRRSSPFLLVVESIEKPGNLGTILRSADAAGCDAVIVCDPVTDIFNPNVVRASTGVLFSVPVVVADSATVHAWLKAKGIRTVATTPPRTNIYTADRPARSAGDRHGQRAIRPERFLAEERRRASCASRWPARPTRSTSPWRRSSRSSRRCGSGTGRP